MKRIVLTTSSSGLDNFNIEHNIEIIRLQLVVNNEILVDGKEIKTEGLHKLMASSKKTKVSTLAIGRHEVSNLFSRLQNEGYDEIFITCLSSTLSESYKIIRQVSYMFKHNMKIFVYDCKELNVCETVMALEANRMLQQGNSFIDIANSLDILRKGHKMVLAVNDLRQLISTETVSSSQTFFSNILTTKPVLEMNDDGSMSSVNQARTFKTSIKKMLKNHSSLLQKPNALNYILCTGNNDLTKRLIEHLATEFNIKNLPVLPASSISIANHGVGIVALCTFSSPNPVTVNFFKQIKKTPLLKL